MQTFHDSTHTCTHTLRKNKLAYDFTSSSLIKITRHFANPFWHSHQLHADHICQIFVTIAVACLYPNNHNIRLSLSGVSDSYDHEIFLRNQNCRYDFCFGRKMRQTCQCAVKKVVMHTIGFSDLCNRQRIFLWVQQKLPWRFLFPNVSWQSRNFFMKVALFRCTQQTCSCNA